MDILRKMAVFEQQNRAKAHFRKRIWPEKNERFQWFAAFWPKTHFYFLLA